MKKRQRKKQHKIKTLRDVENYVNDIIVITQNYVNHAVGCVAENMEQVGEVINQLNERMVSIEDKVLVKPKKKAEATNE